MTIREKYRRYSTITIIQYMKITFNVKPVKVKVALKTNKNKLCSETRAIYIVKVVLYIFLYHS